MSRVDIPLVMKAKTDSTYSVVPSDYGSVITNRGGGALTVTLPAPSATNKGCYVDFYTVAAGDFVLTTTAGEEMVLLNNATADSLTIGQANEEIGNGVRALSDGTSWLCFVSWAAEAVTSTVTDA
jgi:hypothetical protein